MRRITLLLAVAAFALSAARVSVACDTSDGTVPGTPGKVYAFGSGPATFYLDDRDAVDLDQDGHSEGFWVYREANGAVGLQRGGSQLVLALIPATVPIVPPTYLVPPNPVLPNGVVIFPAGFGGGSVARNVGGEDPCVESGNPDPIIGFVPKTARVV